MIATGLKNILVLGSGRCGTSMITGALAQQNYYMGSNLYSGTITNPKGFFESWEINSINEDLLVPVFPKRPRLIGRWFFKDRPSYGQGWLGRLPVGTVIPSSSSINERIVHVTQKQPFCFKDPRFPYTLSAWQPFLSDTVFVCIFRDPISTAASVIKACKSEPYLRSVYIDTKLALEMWELKYRHILEVHRHQGEWLFMHYNQGFTKEGLDRLSTFLNIEVDRNFPDRSLNRSQTTDNIAPSVKRVYDELCGLAGYRGE